jgi:hypothetical protein
VTGGVGVVEFKVTVAFEGTRVMNVKVEVLVNVLVISMKSASRLAVDLGGPEGSNVQGWI